MNDPILDRFLSRPVERFQLSNGLTVLYTPDTKAPVVSVQVWVKTGSIHEDGFMGTGISHFVEHMLFKGTAQRSFKDISSEVQAAGGNINAYTTFDRTVYYIDGCSEACHDYLGVLADMVFNSVIDPEETAREQQVILREIAMCEDDPDRRIAQCAFAESFRQHPYRYPVIGERALFEKLTRDDLLSYYRERYVPNNMVLSIAGDIGTLDLAQALESTFGAQPKQRLKPVYIPEEPSQLGRRALRVRGDYQIARGSLVFRVPGLYHRDAAALDMLAILLGQGNSSVLWQRLHDELGWVHSISASCWNPGGVGMFWISYTCDNGDEQRVEDAVLETIQALSSREIHGDSVRKALRCAIVSQVNSAKTASGMASRNASFEVVAGDLNFAHAYFENAFIQTPDKLLAVARTWLQPKLLSSVHLVGATSRGVDSVGRADSLPLPDFKETVLKNGVRIIHQCVPGLPKVAFKCIFLGGPVYESDAEKGGCAMLATLLARDTAQRKAYEVASAIEGVGGAFNEIAGNNTFGLSLEVLSDDLLLAVRTLAEGILSPRFDPHTFDLEREGQVAQIYENLDDALESSRLRLRERFFEDHPFSACYLGTVESLQAMRLETLRELYARLVVPQNLVIAVSGDFHEKELLELLQNAFSGMSGSVFTPRVSALCSPPARGIFYERLDREQTIIQCAFREGGIKGKLYYAGDLLDELFSGMSSALFEQVRERRGLAYYVHSSRTLGVDCGMFSFCAGTTWEAKDEVLRLIREEIQRVSVGAVGEDELARCRMRLKSQKRIQQQSPSARAMTSALYAHYGLPVNVWRDYDTIIDAVSAETLAEITRGFLEEEGLTLICSPDAPQ